MQHEDGDLDRCQSFRWDPFAEEKVHEVGYVMGAVSLSICLKRTKKGVREERRSRVRHRELTAMLEG